MFSIKKKLLWLVVVSFILAGGVYLFLTYHSVTTSEKINPSGKLVEDSILLDGMESVSVFYKDTPKKGLLILISDITNKNPDTDYINKFSNLSYYVAVINNDSLMKMSRQKRTSCVNVSSTLMLFSHAIKNKYNIADDQLPILVGHEKASNLVYTALAQSDKRSFHAGISIQFSPTLPTPTVFCDVNGIKITDHTNLTRILPIGYLPASWYVFEDITASENVTNKAFYAAVKNAKITVAEPPSETPIDEAIQILQWLDPRLLDQISSDISDSDLPLIEVPATVPPTKTMAVLLTGDGGWAAIDKNIARILAEKGVHTVGFDSLSYFWRVRTPNETAQDLDNTIIHYQQKWQTTNVILIGYSFGADVLPFVTNRLSLDTQKNISLVALLGMGKTAAFKFRLSSWLNADKDPTRIPTLPEIANMKWANALCIYGMKDKESACKETEALGVKVIEMSGDHHFDEKYEELVQHILENVKPNIAVLP